MSVLLITALACCGPIAPDEPAVSVEARADLDRMQGGWVRVSSEASGNKRILEKPLPVLIVAEGKFTFGAKSDPEDVKLDPGQSPKAIDLTPTGDSAGPLKGKTYPGIYKIEGDTLTLCLSIKPGSKRPTEFTTVGNQWVIDVYERQKPAAQ
jgi:uncharacterized protein (TIGR03067 family)